MSSKQAQIIVQKLVEKPGLFYGVWVEMTKNYRPVGPWEADTEAESHARYDENDEVVCEINQTEETTFEWSIFLSEQPDVGAAGSLHRAKTIVDTLLERRGCVLLPQEED